MRSENFWEFLNSEWSRQHGEGLCIAAILDAYLKSIGRWRYGTRWVAKELGTTTENGTDDTAIVPFLKSMQIPTYDEANCSLNRISVLMGSLPPEFGLLISMWDDRNPRPGFTVDTDGAETHSMGVLREEGGHIFTFDPDTYYGGIKRIPKRTFMEIWHDGPDSVWGLAPSDGTHIGQANVGWVMVLGADRTKVHRLVGPAEYEIDPYRFDKKVAVPKNGRLRVDPEGVEPSSGLYKSPVTAVERRIHP